MSGDPTIGKRKSTPNEAMEARFGLGASIRMGYDVSGSEGGRDHNVALSRQHMAANDASNPNRTQAVARTTGSLPGGGGLRPERLTGAQMDEISPGWTAARLERAHRSDGGNG